MMTGYTHDLLPGDGEWTCFAMPVQAEGHLADGRMWYFRARHGDWTLRLSPGPTDLIRDAVTGEVVAEGDDEANGCMPAKEAAAAIHEAFARLGLAAREREAPR